MGLGETYRERDAIPTVQRIPRLRALHHRLCSALPCADENLSTIGDSHAAAARTA